ncbi:P-loop containing nucleoside triphosphate hydrolase protein [Chytridium lagenaria]|nr:P-loop containing nucleoside triphosphate hydrolase protein [Chytridium lagenaria]
MKKDTLQADDGGFIISTDAKGIDAKLADDASTVPQEEPKPKNNGLNETAGPSPELTANLLSRGIIEWLTKFMVLASKKALEYKDVFDVEPRFDAKRFGPFIEKVLGEARDSYYAKNAENVEKERLTGSIDESLKLMFRNKLIYALFSIMKWEWLAGGFACLLAAVAGVMSPVVLQFVIRHLLDSSQPVWKGYMLCVLLFILQVVQSLALNTYRKINTGVGIGLKSAVMNVVFRKSLRLSSVSRQEYANGRITNFVSMDAQVLEYLGHISHGLWSIPLQVIAMSAVIIVYLGYGGAAGVGFMVVVALSQQFVVKKIFKLEGLSLKATDGRVRLTTEMISGMKIIKLFSWEDSFVSRILEIRATELKRQFTVVMLSAIFYGLTYVIPSLVAIIAFSIFSIIPGNSLSPDIVFPALALINLLRVPMLELPETVTFGVEAYVTMGRIARFLAAPELEAPRLAEDDSERNLALKISEKNRKPKQLPSADSSDTLVSSSDAEEVVLDGAQTSAGKLVDIDFEIEKTTLVAIVGPVGAGKSSFLQAILGEMPKTSGTVDIYGKIAYSPQQGWLLNTSLKDNILFGSPFDEARYKQVLAACQAARVNLARSMYSDAEILLLDDPLAAVDAHVGKHIFENAITGPLAKGRTVVLVTHQLHYLPHVDRIFYFEDGSILEKGSFSTLVTDGERFSKLMSEYGGVSSSTNESTSEDAKIHNTETDDVEKVKEADTLEQAQDDKAPKALMVQEEREEGAVKLYHYKIYFAASGGIMIWFFALFLALSMQGDRVLNDYWLVFWSANQFNLTNSQYIGFYTLLGLIQGIGASILALLVTYTGLRGSRVLHQRALTRVVYAPMSFFDTNPMGRIVNRFSRDVAEIDRWLALVIRGCLNLWSAVFCNLILIGYIVPVVFAVVVPTIPIYFYIQKFYRNASRELKRLEAIGRSPLFSQFSETLMGLSTVRAFGSSERFIEKNQDLINVANRPTLLRNYVDIWVSIRAEFFVAVLCLAVSCFGLAFRINPALLGLSVGYTLTLTSSLNFALRLISETEGRMNSVERLNYYGTEVPNEAPMDLPAGKATPAAWPENGAIVLKNVDVRYRPELPLVLKGLNASIKAGEKIGIVGRTGAGKSSVISALYRIVELSSGSIIIDDVDISRIGLRELRTKLSIIPQMPILFQGTIRSNLDHSGMKTDSDLWEALEGASLKDFVSSLDNKLDAKVQENGENLSVGQRQLLCLARAMLVRPKILLIDEATASVDIKTDAAIQKALRVSFKESTILTVAHRLVTIIDYDRILVLQNGEVVEFDTPNTLVNQAGGIFSNLVDETGPSNAALLRKIAEEGFANIDIEKAVEQSK